MSATDSRAATELTDLTAVDARQLLDVKEISSVELTDAHLARIGALDDQLNCYITVMTEVAREQARTADKRIASGESGALTGIPTGLKDILCTTDAPTTAASKILAGYRSPYDATVVRKLREQNAVFLGKLNTDEFAMGSSTENSVTLLRRIRGISRVFPAGVRGGSAASVAAGEAIISLGSDTGGSIRQPAGFCGIVGLKPTYGRVSRYGLIAFASSLDQIGPFATNSRGCAILLGAIAGHDPRDSTSAPLPVPITRRIEDRYQRNKIGIARELAR